MKIVFMGTPDFAVPSLEVLHRRYSLAAVITQPDRKGNRNRFTPPPVKIEAQKRGIALFQFEKMTEECVNLLNELAPDLIVTCAFGQLLPQSVLDIPKFGVLNVHASLLPKYRGAAPISWAIVNGEKETGVSVMRTELSLDTGDILLCKKTSIFEEETAGELFERLSRLGAEAIEEAVDLLIKGKAIFTPQNDNQATYCSQLKKTDGLVDFSKSAAEVFNHIRGMSPWPGAYTRYNGKTIKILCAHKTTLTHDVPFGTILENKNELSVACGDGGAIVLSRLQKEGGKVLPAQEFLRGFNMKQGTVLG